MRVNMLRLAEATFRVRCGEMRQKLLTMVRRARPARVRKFRPSCEALGRVRS